MLKMLILEDRNDRQKKALEEKGISFDNYENFIDNMINDEFSSKFDKAIDEIEKEEFDFSKYHTVAVHNTYTSNNLKIDNKIRNVCIQKNINLVYFSGGADKAEKVGEKNINLIDGTFYSENLFLFLENMKNGINNLSILKYGKSWDLNKSYDLLRNMKTVIDDKDNYDTDDEEPYLTFGSDINKELINFDLSISNLIENEWMKVSDAKEIFERIEDYIEEAEDGE